MVVNYFSLVLAIGWIVMFFSLFVKNYKQPKFTIGIAYFVTIVYFLEKAFG